MVKIGNRDHKYVCRYGSASRKLNRNTACSLKSEEGIEFVFVRNHKAMMDWPCAKVLFDEDRWSSEQIHVLLDNGKVHAFSLITDGGKRIPRMRKCFRINAEIVVGICLDHAQWKFTLNEQLAMMDQGKQVPVIRRKPLDTKNPLWASDCLKEAIQKGEDLIAAVGLINATVLLAEPNDIDTAIVLDLLLSLCKNNQKLQQDLDQNWPGGPRILRLADFYDAQQGDFTIHYIRQYYLLSKENQSDTDAMMRFLINDRMTSISFSFGNGEESAFLDNDDMDRYLSPDYFRLCLRSALVYALEKDAVMVVRITVSEDCDEMYGFIFSNRDILSVPKETLAGQFASNPAESELAVREKFCEMPYFRKNRKIS